MLLFVGLMIVGVAEAAVGTACKSESDCGRDECCLAIVPMKGKRATSGQCQLKGTEASKSRCYVENRFYDNGVYTNKCPCAAGQKCESLGYMEIPQGTVGACRQATKLSTPTSCQSGADCGPDECCRSRMRPLGKRQLGGGGVCEPLGTTGTSCLARYPSGKPKAMAFTCPCKAGMTCSPNGQMDIPLGEMGNCK
ncbi:uncharacterized protein LOC124290128 [Haliotis rubra]|uniref:uncharacterized protein LOC124290128 n=1 Tax=Haliotis rubra TaxID=36100 RepID=UPI001EE60771|nr:uncharacterized protein LOC124290128 [Haliotis rubra]